MAFHAITNLKFLQTILVLTFIFCTSTGQYYEEEKVCGTLFSNENFEGQQFTLKDRGQSINLEEDHRGSDTGWGSTSSIKIETGCVMTLCNETYFDGSCQDLEHGSYPLLQGNGNISSEIVSVSCFCKKECKCSDIYMKRSSCARAYLDGGCRACHSLYTDLDGAKPYFPVEFMREVKALRLRKGCTLTVYPEEDYEGEEEIIQDEIVEDYAGKFLSYECECNDDEYEQRILPPRPESYPPLIDIPNALDEVIKLLTNKTYTDHPGLRAAHNSLKHGRSSKNAYIMLLGSTGAGKSSAINLLFDNPNVTKVGEEKSTTTDIHEFRIPVPVDELGVANSELRVIDTPGLGDTRGLEQDAKFLATLDGYLSNHEELKDRIPNVVLIFHKFHDNRFNGEGSSFVKMIRGLDSFRQRITDENYSNVIFVLSHFCSETKANKRKPETRLSQFKAVIENYSLFPRPTIIVVAENKAKDQELPQVNGYFKLPNNEYYPRNLFEKMELVTENGGDTMGLGVFRTAFRDSEDFNVTSSTYKLVAKGSSKVEYYLRILSNAFFGVEKTEISQLLQTVWDEKVNLDLKKQFPDSLHYLQKSLNIRNVNTKEDIPKTTTAVLELLTAIKHDEATRTLLEKALNIKPPVFPQNTVAGHSYNVFKDTYLSTSPFSLGDIQQSDIGFMIPKILTCKLDHNSKEIFHIFDTKDQYVQQRLQNLGIEGNVALESFTGTIKPGYNIKSLSFKEDGCSLTATREFRLFDFVLNDRLDLTPEFRNRVTSLPVYDETDYENVEKWNNFFNDYGTHVVKSIHGGGSIEIQLTSEKPYDSRMSQALFDLIKFAEDMVFLIADEDENDEANGTVKTVLQEGIAHSLTYHGGDSAYHTNDLTRMSVEQAAKLLTNWKKSLKYNPTVMTTEMRLMPISQIVKKLGQNISSEIDRTTNLLFKSSLKPVKKSTKPTSGPGLAREETPFLSEFLKLQAESNQKIQEMMLDMRRKEQENEMRRQEMEQRRLEWEREQKRLDNEYRIAQLNANQQADIQRQQFQAEMEEARQRREESRLKQQEEFQRLAQEAQEAAARRNAELMKHILDRPMPSGGSCLKTGTKILMADLTEKPVETIRVGDTVLDKDFNPTKVLGVAHEYLLNQKFYGFDQESHFFTDTHLFTGPLTEPQKGDRYYAKSVERLYHNNPLLRYLNVERMEGEGNLTSEIFYLDKSANSNDTTLLTKHVHVYEDAKIYSPETPVYFIQVDSPSGTYFANGYVCRHEIPPIENWPHTMSVLFRLMKTPEFEKISRLPYTIENVYFFQEIMKHVALTIENYLKENIHYDEKELTDPCELMTFADINLEECISTIFSSPTISSAAVQLYAETGVVMSPILDRRSYNENPLPEVQVAKLQHDIYKLIRIILQQYIG